MLNVYHHRLRSILILTCSVGILIWKPALSGQGDTRIPSAKGQEIPIGIGTLLSGDKAALGREVLDGAAAYLEIHPSVLGHPMTLVPMDDGCDVMTTIQAAESFCARIPRPVAVIGYLCSPGTLAALPIHGDCRLPLLNVSSGDERLTHEGSSWILRLWTSRARQGLLVCRWARSKRIRSVLVIQDTDSTSQAIVEDFQAFLPNLSSRTKARVAALEEVEGSPSESFKGRSAPQLVYYVGRGAHLETLWGKLPSTALRRSWILDPRAALSVEVSHEDPRPKELYRAALDLPTGDPQGPPFKYFRGRFGEPGVYTLTAYDALAVLADALERSGRQSANEVQWRPEELMRALRETRLQGLSGAISFDAHGDRLETYGKVSRWKEGKWQVVWEGHAP